MFTITVSEEIRTKCPQYHGIAVYAEVRNTPYDEGLWQEIAHFTEHLQRTETTESIKQQTAIVATREAYRACGKDPSRYRPSAEALRRRLLRGLDLYRIDTLVDLVNLVSGHGRKLRHYIYIYYPLRRQRRRFHQQLQQRRLEAYPSGTRDTAAYRL